MAVFYSLFQRFFCLISPFSLVIIKNDTLFTLNRNVNLAIPILFCFISISILKSGNIEAFISMDVLKRNVLKPEVLKPDVLYN